MELSHRQAEDRCPAYLSFERRSGSGKGRLARFDRPRDRADDGMARAAGGADDSQRLLDFFIAHPHQDRCIGCAEKAAHGVKASDPEPKRVEPLAEGVGVFIVHDG